MKKPLRTIGAALRRMFRPRARAKTWRTFIAILTLFLFSAFLSYSKPWNDAADWINARTTEVDALAWVQMPHYWDIPFRLGLDLQGGTHLVYEADVSDVPRDERAAALEGVRDVIERRVNAFGVSEPVVQTNRTGGHWRIIAELAGIQDVNEAIQLIGETPILEFKEEREVTQVELTEEQQAELEALQTQAEDLARDVQRDVSARGEGADFDAVAAEHQPEDERIQVVSQKLGAIGQSGPHAELWAWADANQGRTLSAEPVETDEGYHIVRMNGQESGATEINASHILICYDGATGCTGGMPQEEARNAAEQLRDEVTPENFEEIAALTSTEPNAEETGGSLGWFGRGAMVPAFEEPAFALETGEISDVVETEFGYHLIYKKDEREAVRYDVDRIAVTRPGPADVAPPADPWKNTDLSGKHLERSQVQFDPTTNEPQVVLYFNPEGDQLFEEITDRSVGKLVGIFLDGEPISVPRVNQKITGGQAVITGQFSIDEAKLLAQRLNAGALPVPIELLSQQTVGASLGQDSLNKSVKAGLIGFLIVALFMIAYYRLPGLLAAVALVMYASFTLAVFKLLGVTLTLSGVAGFILSVGMAVDANILIFERVKEELKNGRPLDSAVNEGFSRAWLSIRDSNVSSLITAAILYTFTSSAVKGFALTLAIGILISMFSAIFVTRTMLRIVRPWTKDQLWLYR